MTRCAGDSSTRCLALLRAGVLDVFHKQQYVLCTYVVQSHRCHGPSDDNEISQSRGQNRINEGHDAEGRGYPRIEAPDKKECVVSLRRAYQLVSEAAGGHELKPSKKAEHRVGDGPRLVKSCAIFQQRF